MFGKPVFRPIVVLALALVVLPVLLFGEAKLQASPEEKARLESKLEQIKEGELERFDEPDEAQHFYLKKRSEDGTSPIPVEKYFRAMEHMRTMDRYSTAMGRSLSANLDFADSVTLGTWTPLGPGNVGGRTRAIVIVPGSPSTMYAGSVAGGVWKTTNAGGSWSPVGDLLPNIAVTSLSMDPSNSSILYAGTGEGYFNVDAVRGAGIFKTTNGGTSWSQLANTNNSDFHYVNDIAISPNNSSRIYAATRTGVWRSTDAGSTWTRVLNPGNTSGCLDLAIRTDQATDYVFTACGNQEQGTVYRNTDAAGAGSWNSVLSEACMGRTSLAIAPSNQSVIYALTAETCAGNYQNGLHAVFRSTTNGDSGSWTARVRNSDATKLNTVLLSNPVIAFYQECGVGASQFYNQGWYDNVIAVDPADSNRVWTGGIDLMRSDDGGANWGLASYWWASGGSPHLAHADNHAIVFHPQYNGTTNKTMFVGNDGGIFRTDDARAATATGSTAACNSNNTSVSWTELNNNYAVTQFYHGLPYPNGTTYFGGCQDNGTNRGTDAAGIDGWTQIMGGDGGYVAVDPGNTNILFAETTNLSIQKSVDGGSTFNGATTGITGDNGFQFINPFIMDPSNSLRLWTGGWLIWRTTNGGSNWVQASSTTAGNGSVSALAAATTDGNYVLVGMSDGFIHRTTTGLSNTSATNWPVIQPRTGYVSWLTFDPTNKNTAYATYSTFGGTHIYKSTDAGASWAGLDGTGGNTIPDIPVHAIVVDPSNTSRLYAGTDLGVFVTTDGGANWAVENTGFANVVTEALAVNGSNLFAFTHGRGAWRVPTSGSCSYSINPTNQSFTSSGGSNSVNVTAGNGCNWTAVSNDAWITVTSGSNGSGNGTVNYTVAANAGSARTGTITIAGQTFTVNQSGTTGGSNDNCSDATSISNTPYTNSINTTTATTEAGDPTPTCGSGMKNKSVWYRFTAPANGTVTADTFGSNYDTVLSAYTGSCGTFTEVACNDDATGTQSQVSFDITAGTTYYFVVSAFSNDGGSLVFNLDADTSSFLLYDDFADGSASDWLFKSGSWSVVNDELTGSSTKKADAISPDFGGCTNCTFEAIVRIQTKTARISLLAWYWDSQNNVEVQLADDLNKIVLKQKVNGIVVTSGSLAVTVSPNVYYHLLVTYTGGAINVYLDGNLVLSKTAGASPFGIAGVRVKSTNGKKAIGTLDAVAVY